MQYVLSFCSAAMLNLYVEILKLLLVEELYPADMADISYSIEAREKGIVLKFSGYNQKLHVSLTKHSPNSGSSLILS
jgi:secreted Zn-dependent insulinase-like peptidase